MKDGSADDYKEKALPLIRSALASTNASFSERATLGMALEKLGQEQEALAVYDQFLKDVPQSYPLPTNVVADAATMREWQAEWQGLIATVRTSDELLKKSLATKS